MILKLDFCLKISMRIIPAIDIIDGKCVRLSKGDYTTQKVYNESPLEVAKAFEDHGIKYMHLVDLDGAKSKQIVNYKILEQIATRTGLQIDFGGGIKTEEDIKIAFNSGAQQITVGSIASQNPELFLNWLDKYGAEKIILGADAKSGKIASTGWTEISDQSILEFISNYETNGVKYVISTDIEKDGMLEGPSIELYKSILKNSINHNHDINLIASGGITTIDDIYKLQDIGCEGAIIGKAIYEGRIELKELEFTN